MCAVTFVTNRLRLTFWFFSLGQLILALTMNAINSTPQVTPSSAGGDDGDQTRYSETFASLDADVILISTDNVIFKVFRRILIEASPVFQLMFSLPQPDDVTPIEIPSIPMDESSETLDLLLKYLYPMARPNPSFKQVTLRIRTADKYDMEWLTSELRIMLVSEMFLKSNPVQVFLTAYSFRLTEEAQIACKRCLEDVDLLTFPLETLDLGEQRGIAFAQLVQLHQSRARAILENIIPWVTLPVGCHYCGLTASKEPRFWAQHFLPMVRKSILRYPNSKNLFDAQTITTCMTSSGCSTCFTNLDRWKSHMVDLAQRIDQLPCTIPSAE
jgi:hypothetical protein